MPFGAGYQDTFPVDLSEYFRRNNWKRMYAPGEREAVIAGQGVPPINPEQAPPMSQFPVPQSVEDLRRILGEAPKIEDYKPGKVRSFLGVLGGVGAGLASGNPKAAQEAKFDISYAPYKGAMTEFNQRFSRAKTLADIESEIQKGRAELGATEARTAAERAREAAEKAQATKAARETAGLPPSWEAKTGHDIAMENIRHPAKIDEPGKWLLNVDATTGKVVKWNDKTGEVTVEIPGTEETTRESDPTSFKEYSRSKDQFEAANPGKEFISYEAWLDKDANRKKPAATQISLGGMTNQQATKFQQIVTGYNNSPLIKAADRTAIIDGALKRVRANPGDGALQQNLLYSYIQILDTYQSAVREGELAGARDIGSLRTSIENWIARLDNNQIMSPEVILQIANAAEGIISDVKGAAKQKSEAFRSQAHVLGLGDQWDRYIGGFKQSFSEPTPPSTQGGAKDPLGIRGLLGGK